MERILFMLFVCTCRYYSCVGVFFRSKWVRQVLVSVVTRRTPCAEDVDVVHITSKSRNVLSAAIHLKRCVPITGRSRQREEEPLVLDVYSILKLSAANLRMDSGKVYLNRKLLQLSNKSYSLIKLYSLQL